MTIKDGLALLGLVLLAVGLCLYSVSLALCVIGALLLAGGLWSHHVDAGSAVSEGLDDAE